MGSSGINLTTGYAERSGNTGKSKSRTPSPVRARQSPTSTSSPRYADSSHPVLERKGTTPPPPPRISDDIKGNKTDDKKSSGKFGKRGRNESGGKDRDNFLAAEAAADNLKKRKRDEDLPDKHSDNRKSTKSKKSLRDNPKKSRSSQDEDADRETSSSPSPPPIAKENKSRVESKEK